MATPMRRAEFLGSFFFGRLHRWAPQPGEEPPYDDRKDGVDPLLLRTHRFMHENDKTARDWFEEGKFEIVRNKEKRVVTVATKKK